MHATVACRSLLLYGILFATTYSIHFPYGKMPPARTKQALQVIFHRATIADAAELAAFGTKTFLETFSSNRPEDNEAYVQKAFSLAQQTQELQVNSSSSSSSSSSKETTTTILARSSCDAQGQLLAYAQMIAPVPLPKSVLPRTDDDQSKEFLSVTMQLKRFYVDSHAHGCGVAPQLMDQVFDIARNARHGHIWLSVWEENQRAISYYTKKAGFWDVGSMDFLVGADPQTDRVLVAVVPPEL